MRNALTDATNIKTLTLVRRHTDVNKSIIAMSTIWACRVITRIMPVEPDSNECHHRSAS